MRATREQLRARLEAKAQAVIEEIVGWSEERPAPTLAQLEDKMLELRGRLGAEMVEALLEGQEAVQPALESRCPTCGEKLCYKGRKDRVVESRVGALRFERGYYYCTRCESGVFPPRHSA